MNRLSNKIHHISQIGRAGCEGCEHQYLSVV
jgi:hypothetical protein